jgi:cobalt/nickel transport protein
MKRWLWGLVIAVAVAVFLSPLASRWPDGLEKVAARKGFLYRAEGKQVLNAPMPDYAMPGLRNAPVSTATAGFLGTIAAFGLAFGAGRLLARRRKSR